MNSKAFTKLKEMVIRKEIKRNSRIYASNKRQIMKNNRKI
jgi:hypothetical protein